MRRVTAARHTVLEAAETARVTRDKRHVRVLRQPKAVKQNASKDNI